MASPLAPVQEVAPAASRRRPAWALLLVIVAVIAVAVAFFVGVVGLTSNPVKSQNADGTITLQGTFEPYVCDAASCNGYVQAGARSVFVQFPANCRGPIRGSTITVTAKPAPDLGKGSYRASACA